MGLQTTRHERLLVAVDEPEEVLVNRDCTKLALASSFKPRCVRQLSKHIWRGQDKRVFEELGSIREEHIDLLPCLSSLAVLVHRPQWPSYIRHSSLYSP